MGMTNEQLLQSITTVIVDRFDMLDGRIERLEQRVDKMDTEFRQKFEQIDQKFEQIVVVKHFCNTLFENSPGISSFKWCFPIIVGMRTDMIVPYVHISV